MVSFITSRNLAGKGYQPLQWGSMAEDQLCSASFNTTLSPALQTPLSSSLRVLISSGMAALIVS